jgi:hypothetical protein
MKLFYKIIHRLNTRNDSRICYDYLIMPLAPDKSAPDKLAPDKLAPVKSA